MVNLKAEDVKGWPIPAAPLGEQKKFAQRMDRVREEFSRLRRSINRQIELLKERRRSLITAAVTGQIDVTTARGADLS